MVYGDIHQAITLASYFGSLNCKQTTRLKSRSWMSAISVKIEFISNSALTPNDVRNHVNLALIVD